MAAGPSGVTSWAYPWSAEGDGADMSEPDKIARFLDLIHSAETRHDRIELLIGIADRFQEVPSDVAERPYDSHFLVPHCESDVYFWPVDLTDGTLDFHFAVENPQGISARAMAVILREGLAGESLEDDLPLEIFGHELSMGKSMGLNSMVSMVRLAAEKRIRSRQEGF